MGKMNTRAGMLAHAVEAIPCKRAPAFELHATQPPPAQPRRVGRHLPVGGYVKRAIDIALALLALAVLLPMFVLVAVAVRIGLGRPIFVTEQHIGFAGQIFTAYAFRTSPTYRTRELERNPSFAAYLACLRNSGLDRLPRLFNVLRGDMSFVGPRPVTLSEFERRGHCPPDYLATRPGLVAPRRAGRSGNIGYRTRSAIERCYARRWSVWLDLALLASTIVAIRDLTNRS